MISPVFFFHGKLWLRSVDGLSTNPSKHPADVAAVAETEPPTPNSPLWPRSARLAEMFVLDHSGPVSTRRTAEGTATQRRRLIAAIVAAVAENGYPDTTLTDVVARARVSRRTFYEQFTGKQECFLEAFDAFSSAILADIVEAVASKALWTERLVAGVDAYVGGLFTDLNAGRVFNIDVYSVGTPALARRRALHNQWATMMRDEILNARRETPEIAPLVREITLHQTNCIVGGVREAAQAMLEVGGTPDPALLRRIALDLNLSMALNVADAYVDLLV